MLRGDFDAIVSKALRAEPAHRYETVDALKLDVERAVRGEAVAARTGARLYQFGRLVRRYRWGAIAVVTVFLSLAVGLGAAAWQARRVEIERDAARRDANREQAIRYQLTRLFRTAIADRGSGPITAKAMLDAGAQRVLREYRDDPQQAGQIVITLSELYDTLADVQGAAALLEGYLREADPRADPATVADARQKFSNLELMRGNVAHAGQLLTQAEAFWASVPTRYAEERIEGLGLRARERRAAGDLEGAIKTMHAAIAQRLALSGRDNRETAVLYNSYAIILTSAHRLDEALNAYRETDAIYRALGLGEEIDSWVVLGNIGGIEVRLGHLKEAEMILQDSIRHQRDLTGNSGAMAAHLGYYGRLLSLTGRPTQAVATLSEAAAIAAQYTGPSSPLTVQDRLFLGEAQLTAGDLVAARATLTDNEHLALGQYGPGHPLTLRTRLALARLAIAEGHDAAAQAQLAAIIPGLRSNGPQTVEELAQAASLVHPAQLPK